MPNDRLTHLNTSLTSPWAIENDHLCKTFMFPDFKAAFGFVTQLALLYEKADHHPDTTLRYNQVEIRSTTHDAGNIVTDKDFALAQKIEEAVRG
jgi:4a-hydroxytetrahydrobiopterin dehydratase